MVSKDSMIEIEGLQIKLIQKKMKSVSIRISPPDGSIRVSAPLRYSRSQIMTLLQDKVAWMKTHQLNFLRRQETLRKEEGNSPSLLFLQKRYAYQFIEHASLRGPVDREGILHIHVARNANAKQKQLAITRWYQEALTKHLSFFMAKWSLILGVNAQSFTIRQMKTKWGSCNITDKKITFNLELIKHSLACIEYVVVHELVHLIEPSHNARFKRFMTNALPNWKALQKQLNAHHIPRPE